MAIMSPSYSIALGEHMQYRADSEIPTVVGSSIDGEVLRKCLSEMSQTFIVCFCLGLTSQKTSLIFYEAYIKYF